MIVRQKGYKEFVPIYRCRRRWSDRIKSIDLPLFPGYVFCRLDPMRRLPLLTIPGVLHFVGIRNAPIAIDDAEMAAIRIATESGLAAEPWPYFEDGQPVMVQGGPLERLEGRLVESRNQCRLVVSMSVLRQSVAVEIDRKWVATSGNEESLPSPLSLAPTNDNPGNGCGR